MRVATAPNWSDTAVGPESDESPSERTFTRDGEETRNPRGTLASSAGFLRQVGSESVNDQIQPEEEEAVTDARTVAVNAMAQVSFNPIQEWEGVVVEVFEDRFVAQLTDLTLGSDAAEEEGEFPIEDVQFDDRDLAVPGGVFWWGIGYQRDAGGSRKRVSHVVFRRMPQWTERDVERAYEAGAELAAKITWEDGD